MKGEIDQRLLNEIEAKFQEAQKHMEVKPFPKPDLYEMAKEAELRATLTRPEPEAKAVPVAWRIAETLPGGSVRWQVVEHELHARDVAKRSGYPATIAPLYLHPPEALAEVEARHAAEVDDLCQTANKNLEAYLAERTRAETAEARVAELEAERDKWIAAAVEQQKAKQTAEAALTASRARVGELEAAMTAVRTMFKVEYDEEGRVNGVAHGSVIPIVDALDAALQHQPANNLRRRALLTKEPQT
jgi:hypothetical protein